MKQDQLSPHRILASRMLAQWATEIHQGGGAPNILAVLERIGDGDQFFHISPGPIFSPMAARADLIIKDIRDHEPRMAMLLIAQALEVSRQRIANGSRYTEAYRRPGPARMLWRVLDGDSLPRESSEGMDKTSTQSSSWRPRHLTMA